MNKRNSKKYQDNQHFKLQNYINNPTSPNKNSIDRRVTFNTFKKQKQMMQLPTIFPLHNITKHKRYIHNYFVQSDISLNLIGIKYNKKIQKQHGTYEQFQYCDQIKKDKFMLKKYESIKYQFLENIINNNGYSKISMEKKDKLKVYIEQGNNSRLINQLIRRRPHLKIVLSKTEANIVWTRFCDCQQANLGCNYFQKEKRKFSDSTTNEGQSVAIINATNKKDTISTKNLKLKEIVLTEFKYHNHLKNHHEISDKKCLFKNIKRYCKIQMINQSEIIPKTYHIDGNIKDLPQNLCLDKKMWIIKPGQDTNRGNGISVQQGRQNVIKAINHLDSIGKSALVQEYIEPLLYKNRKFDLRCYALITTYCGNLKAYWYKQGYLRTSCKQFNNDPSNIFAHLTNDAIQKKHKDYGKYEPNNKLSFSDLQAILKDKDMSYNNTLQKMKELAYISIKSAEDKLAGQKNMFSFQIFGYDFLIDAKGKLWLIEVNTNPCLQFSGSLLSRIIWHMVQNSLAIALDPFLMNLPQGNSTLRQKIQKIYQDSKFQCII